MSVMIAQQWYDRAIVITDTIASDRATGDRTERTGFGMKTWTLPHLNMVFAFRGASLLAHRWHHRITEVTACRDIEDVHAVALEGLSEMVAATARQFGAGITGEFYHFGFPHDSEQIVHYRYEPKNEYAGERLVVAEPTPDGVRTVLTSIAPTPVTFPWPNLQDPDVAEYVALVDRIRDENDRRLVSEPIAIGGDLFATFVENWRTRTVLWHRFPDYDMTWASIHASQSAADLVTQGSPAAF